MADTWTDKVNEVFNIQPRVGTSRATVWLERTVEDKRLAQAIMGRVHCCIDGPTGVGKSSLALTRLEKDDRYFILIQVWRKMTWRDFCYEVIVRSGNSRGRGWEYTVGVEGGLPTGVVKSVPATERDGELYQRAQAWTVADVARCMVSKRMALMVDDLEKASGGLLACLADLCKLLTLAHVGPQAKVLLVGTGDVFTRILRADRSLHERISQVSLGTFPDPNDSWRFLALDFDKLGLFHPGNSKFEREKRQLVAARKAAYEAANPDFSPALDIC